ncbi:Thymidylate synthase ThyX [Anaerohalosphaera lusitana]|uniref:Flavin-dependent thymidylate synthase n=1 Tax=Anaerohalosphaera lusitana TaxID=1936003 RepID=A0A1U9NJQ1_9BACT|nr:FAD-dependent thymidylate synthase [Anaerohalosphaera lusitana]AQT68152.1 Thymidylate synthase ThyX [Anaerohalosphaera lusitana]
MGQVHARVRLVRMTEDAEGVVASAGRLCYASETEDILKQDKGSAGEFIQRIIKMGHVSILEHAVFTFFVEGVSRALTHQLVRHRIASYSQRSQRYVAHNEFDYIVPPELEGKTVEVDGEQVDAVAYFEETMGEIAGRYAKLQGALGGNSEKSNQDARYVLPNACETKIFVTMNARELLHFFEERLCMRAQWEIRGAAEQMLELAKGACPSIFAGVGPKCVRMGRCPEGKMTCGKYQEMKEKYGG